MGRQERASPPHPPPSGVYSLSKVYIYIFLITFNGKRDKLGALGAPNSIAKFHFNFIMM